MEKIYAQIEFDANKDYPLHFSDYLEDESKNAIEALQDLLMANRQHFDSMHGLYKESKQLSYQLKRELTLHGYPDYVSQYRLITAQEIRFWDPYHAYISGRNMRLRGEDSNSCAYEQYLKDTSKVPAYLNIEKEKLTLFFYMIDALPNKEMRKKVRRFHQLYSYLHLSVKENIKLFFDLGFACGAIL